jgi:hypothetical protein
MSFIVPRRLGNRGCALLVGAAVIALSLRAGPAKAESINMTYAGIASNPAWFNSSEYGGAFAFTPSTMTPVSLGGAHLGKFAGLTSPANTIDTFCIETSQNIQGGNPSFNVVTDLSTVPQPGAPTSNPAMGAATAINIKKMFTAFFDNLATTTGGSYADSVKNNYAAFQLALWTVLGYNPSYSANSADVQRAARYFSNSANYAGFDQANNLVVLSSASGQDQITLFNTDSGPLHVTTTPCPPGVVLGVVAVLGLTGYRWRRRRLLGS